MRLVGLGYRRPLSRWLASRPCEVGFLEFTAEHFFSGVPRAVKDLSEHWPCAVHGLGLSLGSVDSLDKATLQAFAQVTKALNPRWVSEHVSFTKSASVDLGHLTPIAPTAANARRVAGNASQMMDATGKRVALENIAAFLRIPGEMTEPQFLNEICRQSGAGLLLDVTNLYVNSKNHQFCPNAYIDAIDLSQVMQLHVVGYTRRGDIFEDQHAEAIQEDLMEFTLSVVRRTPQAAIVIERDARFPHWHSLAAELTRLQNA